MTFLNLLPHYPFFDRVLSAYDLLMFSLGAFVIITILLLYYIRIPKSNQPKSYLQTLIYQSKDILLQSNYTDSNVLFVKEKASAWVKVVSFILVVIVAVTPFFELLKID